MKRPARQVGEDISTTKRYPPDDLKKRISKRERGQRWISVDHILWECKETEDQRMNMDMRKKQWINGKKGMEKKSDCTTEYRNGKYNRKVSKIKMAMKNRKEEEKQTKMPMAYTKKKERKEMK
jgi:hypothetical protein